MRIANHDTNDKVLIVAEIGNNHEGSFDLAVEMLDLAIDAGADAVKFQTFRTERYVAAAEKDRFARLKSFELTPAQFAQLAERATQRGSTFFSTPFDVASVGVLEPLAPVYKIASGDNDFNVLMTAVARTGKPIILSSGVADLAHVKRSKAHIEHVWAESGIQQELAVLHCVSAYPVPDEQANLRAIPTLARELGCVVGYSDHTMGNEACLAAVALGARIIEKHFTKDHDLSDFRDHKLSATPAEMKQLVAGIRRISAMLGNGNKVVQPAEAALIPALRRSARAARALAAGTTLGADDVMWVRPGGGIAADQDANVIGKRLSRAVAEGELIAVEDLG